MSHEKILYKDLSYKIVGLAMQVHTELGFGFLERINENSLILVTEPLENVWKMRQRVKWDNGEYRVVSRKGMEKMKELAGRPQDLIDLDYLRGLDDEEEN